MKITKRKICLFMAAVALLALTAVCTFVFWYLWASRDVFAAYGAKIMASGVFVAGRTPESIAVQELAILPRLRYTVDRENQTVTARVFGSAPKTAVYRDGLGAALAHDGDIEALRQQARPELAALMDAGVAEMPWPTGDGPSGNPRPPGIDEARLAAAVDGFFDRPSRFLKRHTRALIVVYKDEIVAERYADGFDANQRFSAWSMTKSVFHALYGIAVKQGKLSVDAPIPFWRDLDDPRSEVTVDMLLRMSGGLDYNEFELFPPMALTTMLFLQPGAGDYAAALPLLHPPDTVWHYASASTNILSRALREIYGDDAYYALPWQELFSKTGMTSAIIEADATGTFVGSSFMYATARDYARFGLLYLHDGVWQGERILPEGWAAYGRTPTHTASGNYGAHWWLIAGDEELQNGTGSQTLPNDIFVASGFEGQFIVIIPSRSLVIVHLNLDLLYHSPVPLIHNILAALPE